MEPDGGSASRSGPKSGGAEVPNDWKYVFPDLEQCVGCALEQPLNAGDRPAEPDFGRHSHRGKLAPGRLVRHA